MSAVVKVERPEPLAYAEMERLAASIAKSGLFGIKTPDQAITLMMIAHAEGRHPVEAARDYDVIQGRPAKKAEAMLRDFLSAGGTVKWHDLSDSIADATFSHPVGGSVRLAWDLSRARTAGLADKDGWKKYPRQMLRSRTVSEGVRTVWPMATSGMYVPEEQADIPFTGTTIEADRVVGKPVEPTTTPASLRDQFNAEVPMTPPPPTNGKTRHSVAPPHGAPDEDWRKCLDWIAPALTRLRSREQVIETAGGPTCSDIMGNGPDWAKAELDTLLAENYARFPEAPSDTASDDDLPEIVGQERMGAG
jgi:hypothetical protein